MFKAFNLLTNEDVVVKMLKPVKKEKIRREVMCLEYLYGCPHIVKLYDQVIDPSTKTPSLILEYLTNQDFRVVYETLTKEDIKRYIL